MPFQSSTQFHFVVLCRSLQESHPARDFSARGEPKYCLIHRQHCLAFGSQRRGKPSNFREVDWSVRCTDEVVAVCTHSFSNLGETIENRGVYIALDCAQ